MPSASSRADRSAASRSAGSACSSPRSPVRPSTAGGTPPASSRPPPGRRRASRTPPPPAGSAGPAPGAAAPAPSESGSAAARRAGTPAPGPPPARTSAAGPATPRTDPRARVRVPLAPALVLLGRLQAHRRRERRVQDREREPLDQLLERQPAAQPGAPRADQQHPVHLRREGVRALVGRHPHHGHPNQVGERPAQFVLGGRGLPAPGVVGPVRPLRFREGNQGLVDAQVGGVRDGRRRARGGQQGIGRFAHALVLPFLRLRYLRRARDTGVFRSSDRRSPRRPQVLRCSQHALPHPQGGRQSAASLPWESPP